MTSEQINIIAYGVIEELKKKQYDWAKITAKPEEAYRFVEITLNRQDVSISKILILRFYNKFKFNEINNQLNITSANLILRDWCKKAYIILFRLRKAEANFDSVANLDIPMSMYRVLIRHTKGYDRSIEEINNSSMQDILRGYRGIGEKNYTILKDAIRKYYNGISNFGLMCIDKV